MQLTITRPDDWHLHLRDGEALAAVLPHTARQFARAIVMPNLKPPVTTVEQAAAYRDRILAALPAGMAFEPLMTLYLTETTTAEEVRKAIAEHAAAAQRAMDAGFDGVELHGTSGYLSLQFLHSSTNRRCDEYGGDACSRSRFAAECLSAMGNAIGIDRVGLRLNPGNTFNDTADENSAATHAELMRQAAKLGIAYLHVMRAVFDPSIDAFKLARENFGENLILNDGFDAQSAEAALQAGEGKAVSFARHFIANPDLVQRMRQGLPLARFDRNTLYTPGARGYNDYASAEEVQTV